MDKNGNNHLFLEIARRIRVEELLRQSKAQFIAAFNHAPVAMLLVDSQNLIERMNKAAVKLFSIPSNLQSHVSLKTLVDQKYIPHQTNIACCPHKDHEFNELRFNDKNHQIKYLKLIAVKMRSTNHHSRWIIIFEDITSIVESRRLQSTISRRIFQAHEDEKLQISREIHDTISQSLAALKMSIQANATKDSLISLVDHLITTSRTLSQSLRPETIDNLGLIPALKQLAKGIEQRFDTTVEVSANSNNIQPPPAVSLELFRISQEALTNAARHGQATHIRLRLIKRNHHLKITIQDDGKGFDQQRVTTSSKKSDSLGLKIMLERANHIGAEFSIQSKPGAGTKIIICYQLHL
jgi:two-component system sensor histidine kinase NreB